MPDNKKKIKNPGTRGGKFYINDKGEVIYGEKPKGRKGKVVDEKGQEHTRLSYDNKKEFKDQFPSFEEFNRRAKEKGLPELDSKTYKQMYQREHKEYMKGVKDSGTKENRGSLSDDKTNQFLKNRVYFDGKEFHSPSFKELSDRYKQIHGSELSKEAYMKHYKKQKYQHSKYLKEQEKTKEIPHEKKIENMKKLMFKEDGKMNVDGILQLPKMDGEADDLAEEGRKQMYMDLWKHSEKLQKFLNAEEYGTFKDAVSELFTNTNPKIWKEAKESMDFGANSLFLIDDGLAEIAKKTDKWDTYGKFSDLYGRFSEYDDYIQSGMDKINDKKKESEKKKEKRDKDHMNINKKDKVRYEKYQNYLADKKSYAFDMAEKVRSLGIRSNTQIDNDPETKTWEEMGIPVPRGAEAISDKQWKALSDHLGFKILDGEKNDIYESVIKPVADANMFVDKYSNRYKEDSEARKDMIVNNLIMDHEYNSMDRSLRSFYVKRVTPLGKTFDTPMDKLLFKTKRQFDDKIDEMVDMSVVARAVDDFKYDSSYEYCKKYFDDHSSVSEVIHSLHQRKKEVDSIIDKHRDPFKELDSVRSGDILTTTPEDHKKWEEATEEKYNIERFQEELTRRLKENSDVVLKYAINTFPSDSVPMEANKHIDDIEKNSPDVPGLKKKFSDAVKFLADKTDNSIGFSKMLNKLKIKDLRKADIPENRKHRAFAYGNEFHSNHGEVGTGTIVHELSHILEFNNESISRKATDFYISRTDGLKTYKLKDLYPRSNYRDTETAYIDSFIDPYVGRDYEKEYKGLDRIKNPHSTHELFSMGVQSIYEDAISFMLKDPEHFMFTMNALKG